MLKTDVLTRTADRLKEAAISPRIYNRDCLKSCYIVAYKYKTPIVIRVNVKEFDLDEIADLAKYLEKDFPGVQVSLMAEGIHTYEEAVKAIKAGFGGIAVDDELLLNQEENLLTIKDIARAVRAADVSVQVSVNDVENLQSGKGYELVKKSHVDMLKLMIGKISEEESEKYQHIIHNLRKETLATLTFGEDTYIKPAFMKIFAERGISKFDVYPDYEEACVGGLQDTFDKEPVKDKKLFMLELQGLLNDTFESKLDLLVHKAGHFVKR